MIHHKSPRPRRGQRMTAHKCLIRTRVLLLDVPNFQDSKMACLSCEFVTPEISPGLCCCWHWHWHWQELLIPWPRSRNFGSGPNLSQMKEHVTNPLVPLAPLTEKRAGDQTLARPRDRNGRLVISSKNHTASIASISILTPWRCWSSGCEAIASSGEASSSSSS
jgi:hypothetical protein